MAAIGAALLIELVESFQGTIGLPRLDVAVLAGDRAEASTFLDAGAFWQPWEHHRTPWKQAGSSSTPLNFSPIQVPCISYSFDILQLAVVASSNVSGPATRSRRAAVDARRWPGGTGCWPRATG